jgi:hypothetical protein
MAVYKNVTGDYTITTLSTADNVIVNTNTVKINGNLDVVGNVTYINTTELNITDPFIELNVSNTGSYYANSGILTYRTANNIAGLRFNNNANSWQLSSATDITGTAGAWSDIATGNVVSAAAGSNTSIQYNNNMSFGGDTNYTYDFASYKVTLNGHQVLGNIGSAPSAVANSLAMYHKQVGTGGSGLYVKGDSVDDELVSKTKAIVFSLIF